METSGLTKLDIVENLYKVQKSTGVSASSDLGKKLFLTSKMPLDKAWTKKTEASYEGSTV